METSPGEDLQTYCPAPYLALSAERQGWYSSFVFACHCSSHAAVLLYPLVSAVPPG